MALLLLYADDILLYSPIRNKFEVLDLQGDIDAIANWVNTAGLSLNQSKTKLLLLSRKRQPPSITLSTNSGPITQVDSLSYLGVTITKYLKWNSPHLFPTPVLRHNLNWACYTGTSTKRISPHFPPCTNRWCSHSLITVVGPFEVPLLVLLESVQKFGARICTKRWSDDCLPLLAR